LFAQGAITPHSFLVPDNVGFLPTQSYGLILTVTVLPAVVLGTMQGLHCSAPLAVVKSVATGDLQQGLLSLADSSEAALPEYRSHFSLSIGQR
jgi:hypothetical protein